MDSTEIIVPKKLVYAIAIGTVILTVAILLSLARSENATSNPGSGGGEFIPGSPEKFAFLSGRGEQRSVGST